MTLYSLNGAAPAPLPHRIRVPDGAGRMRTRTDRATFEPAELAAAGGTAARWDGEGWVSPPVFDPASQHPPVWGGAAWSEPALIPLADLASAKRASATAAFRLARDAGTAVDLAPGVSIVVSTTHAAAVELSEGIEEITANGPMTVVTRAGAVVALNLAAAGAMLAGIRAHVRACQEREAALYQAIDAAVAADDRAALLAIDPTAGYPAPPG